MVNVPVKELLSKVSAPLFFRHPHHTELDFRGSSRISRRDRNYSVLSPRIRMSGKELRSLRRIPFTLPFLIRKVMRARLSNRITLDSVRLRYRKDVASRCRIEDAILSSRKVIPIASLVISDLITRLFLLL